MSFDAGSVFAVLGARFNPAGFTAYDAAMKRSIAGAAAAEKNMVASTQRMNAATTVMGANAGRASQVVKAGWLAVGAGAAVGLGKSIQAAMSFEKQMSEVKAVTKAGTADMKLMTTAARDLGVKTGVGATEAARGLTELAKGGMTARQSTAALQGAVALAQAGQMDLADAAVTVVQSLSTFNLKAGDATMVADGLAEAANKTTMDVADFAQAFAQGGSAAQAAGLSFDETLNVLGAMANRFRSGSDMGTSLKTTLAQLASPSKKAADEMKRLNIDLFDHNGKAKSAAEMVKLLGDRFGDMTPKQRLASAAIIAGTDGMRTLINLSQSKMGDGGIREAGAAAATASDKLDNLSGDWQKLKANLEDIGITVGNEVIPKLRDASQAVTQFLKDAREQNEGTTGDKVWGFLKDVGKVAGELGDTLSAVTSPKAFTELMDKMLGVQRLKPLKIEAKVDASIQSAIGTLRDLEGTKIAPKVVHVVEDGALSTQQKIRALIRLGIPPKRARIIVLGAEAAAGKITSVRDLMNSLSSRTVTLTINEVRRRSGAPSSGFSATPPKRAAGRGPGARESALIGEGGGPEAVGNPWDGWFMTRGPMLARLTADDYVIPTEPRYQGRALALMADALGIPAFKAGRKPSKKEKQRRARQDQRIQSADTQAGTAGTQMDTAQETHQRREFDRAKARKLKMLDLERTRLKAALKGAKGSRRTDLRSKLAQVENDIARTRNQTYQPPEVPEPAGSGTDLDANMRAMLDEFDAQIALSELDDDAANPETLRNNLQPLKDKQGYLKRALAAAQSDPRFGGPSAVAQLARDLKSTSDQIRTLSDPQTFVTADQQAQADQMFERGRVAGLGSRIDTLTKATLAGSPTLVFQSYVPPSPSEARRLADYAVGGIGYQGGRPASSERIGV